MELSFFSSRLPGDLSFHAAKRDWLLDRRFYLLSFDMQFLNEHQAFLDVQNLTYDGNDRHQALLASTRRRVDFLPNGHTLNGNVLVDQRLSDPLDLLVDGCVYGHAIAMFVMVRQLVGQRLA